MAYFPGLSPYAYGHSAHPGVVHVGWLDGTHAFPKGSGESRMIEKMKLLAEKPVELYRGKHVCELCVEPPDLQKTAMPSRVVLDPDCSWAKMGRSAFQQWRGQSGPRRSDVCSASADRPLHPKNTATCHPPSFCRQSSKRAAESLRAGVTEFPKWVRERTRLRVGALAREGGSQWMPTE